ncbi:MAG TPA: glycoside hydrolase family 28 protein [Bacteroidales bacterium]|nr:glycoside hydrolase family 28 protein [Bacteroidales bacterium]HPF03425.1 glycoside hydrolase family 28 protein [Bacteroidales bacterium]HPJ60314.1 glycoside hydrolase family 28 protein [Bacteroidales bacterium]HPR13397.1 glycoside hydrolase family 28 protein [Bacteroidales bacterium]HRW86415.1 glycoside hydrolase family 28 protein [Bacteroidales bacterium]
MKRLLLTLIIITLAAPFTAIAVSSEAGTDHSELKWAKKAGARKIPKGRKVYNVTTFGARGDSLTNNTKAIQAAIDACSEKGGGIVTFDDGQYVTGSIFVKKGVTLHIGKNTQILGSQDIADYPEIDTRIAGVEMKWPAALINVMDQKKVSVKGEGTIHARGKPFWDKYWTMRRDYEKRGLRWIVDYDCRRPRTLLVQNSSDVTVEGLTFKQAGFWTVQLLYSSHLSVDGITILNNIDGSGPSTDGIDIDSSSWILVENCTIDCNDDDFCLKAGRDADGLRVNRPTEYVVIRNCTALRGAGLITCGSETSGGIRNVLAYNLIANGTTNCINFKSAITRGGTVENIYVHDITMNNVGTMLRATMDWNPSYSYSSLPEGYSFDSIPHHWKVFLQEVPPEQGTPHFKNVHLWNMKGTVRGSAVSISGMKESPIENFFLSDIEIDARSPGSITNAKGWRFKNVNIRSSEGSELRVSDSEDMQVKPD